MRFEQLILERYGHFDGLTLDLSGPDVLLHVIYGPNEAGKSTALAAICDLLFKFPHRSPYSFLHAHPLVGATLSNAAGQRISFKRRKANANTLLMADESGHLPDSALTPFLGGTTRESFERMFGLNHERLRAGGKAMLEAGGDLARSLFEAGSGTTGLATVMTGLVSDADAIGAPGGRKSATKPYWQAAERFEAAQAEMRAEGLKAEAWNAAGKALHAAESRRREIEEQLTAHGRERTTLERVRRTVPLLRHLDQLRQHLVAMAGAGNASLPDDFEDVWRGAVAEVDKSAAQVIALGKRHHDALAALDGADAPGPWVLVADRIEKLATDLGGYRTKRNDLPNRLRDIETGERQMTELIRQLGAELSKDEVAAKRPSDPSIARVRRLIGTWTRLDAEREKAAKERTDAERLWADAKQDLAEAGTPSDPAEALAALAAANALGDTTARLLKVRLDANVAEEKLKRDLNALGRWDKGADALAATAFPAAEVVGQFEQTFLQLEADERACDQEVTDAQELRRRTDGDLAALKAAGEVPTADVLGAARARRDQGWRVIRRRHLDGVTVADEEVRAFAPVGDLAGAFEGAVAAADQLADRRQEEAARIEKFALLSGQDVEAGKKLETAQKRAVKLAEKRAGQDIAWAVLWQPAGMVPGTPAQMRAWLTAKDRVLVQHQTAEREAALCKRLEAEETLARGHLLRAAAALGLAGIDGLNMAALKNKVQTACSSAEAALAAAKQLTQEVARRKREWDLRVSEAANIQRQLDAWQMEWAAEMPKIGLAASARTEEAEAALGVWQKIGVLEADLSQSRRRRDQIDDAIRLYAATVKEVVSDLGAAAVDIALDTDVSAIASDTDVSAIVPLLQQRLLASRSATIRLEQARAAVEAAATARDDAQSAADKAVAALKALLASHGIADDEDVLATARASTLRRKFEADIEDTIAALARQGDGLDETALRAAARDVDFDAVSAAVEQLDTETTRLQGELQEAARALTTAEAEIRRIQGREGVGAAAQAANDAAVEMVAFTEQWLRLRAASLILNRAVERYRSANQHPLVRRADELFQTMAALGRNPITSLSPDYTDEERPVLVGRRGDGSSCPVSGMSDGTLDQLYLALRIAAVEHLIEAVEPMPFVADDLFITSDEERTLAGLKALAELGQKTQVLLFTHHRYVVDAVQAALPAGHARVHNLRMA